MCEINIFVKFNYKAPVTGKNGDFGRNILVSVSCHFNVG